MLASRAIALQGVGYSSRVLALQGLYAVDSVQVPVAEVPAGAPSVHWTTRPQPATVVLRGRAGLVARLRVGAGGVVERTSLAPSTKPQPAAPGLQLFIVSVSVRQPEHAAVAATVPSVSRQRQIIARTGRGGEIERRPPPWLLNEE